MHDNPLQLKPFSGLKDYFLFLFGKGSYWEREKLVKEAKQRMAEHLEFLDTFPQEQRAKLLTKYTAFQGMNAKIEFIQRLKDHVAALKAQQAKSVSGKLPQDTLKRIERMPAAQQETMKEYYLKKLYGKDFEKHLEEDSSDEMAEALLDV